MARPGSECLARGGGWQVSQPITECLQAVCDVDWSYMCPDGAEHHIQKGQTAILTGDIAAIAVKVDGGVDEGELVIGPCDASIPLQYLPTSGDVQ